MFSCALLFLLLIHSYPVDAKFGRKLGWFAHSAYPFSAKLIGEYNIERIVGPRELVLLFRNTGISKGLLVVDKETNAVGMNLGSIRVPFVGFDFSRS